MINWDNQTLLEAGLAGAATITWLVRVENKANNANKKYDLILRMVENVEKKVDVLTNFLLTAHLRDR